jgi:hypothetical protein
VLSTELLEPNRLREQIEVKTVQNFTEEDGTTSFLVEFESVFAGWIVATNISGHPHSTVSFGTSSVPLCDTAYNHAASAEGRPFCVPLSKQGDTGSEYNMVHEYVLGETGAGAFTPRFSYHEVRYLKVMGAHTLPRLVGYKLLSLSTGILLRLL